MKLLLKRKAGLTIEEIADELKITRPAIRQHLIALERQGYVERGTLLVTGGRPSQTYKLTEAGYHLFPKQYSWFSEVLLERLKSQLGPAGLSELMRNLGAEVGREVAEQVQGESPKAKVEKTAKLLNDLAYQAETSLTGREMPGAPPVIEATNCVFHNLAIRFPEVCQFDLALLAKITGADVVHEQCMIRGGETCRFRFKPL